jgi:adenylate cyclase
LFTKFFTRELRDRLHAVRQSLTATRILMAVAIAVLIAGLLLAQTWGWTQSLELAVFDRMVQMQPDPGPDPRLLVVEITESDLQRFQKWPLSDRIYAHALQELQKHHPKAIALDIFRDLPNPPGYEELVAQLQQPNVIGITYFGNSNIERIPPPPTLAESQVAFSDLLTDPDGVVRRNLMFLPEEDRIFQSLSLSLALFELDDRGLTPKIAKDNNYHLGNAIFTQLKPDSGGYQAIDAGGYQILLHYRSRDPARRVTLGDLLDGRYDPAWVEDKLVAIGTTAPSLKDTFFTPYSEVAEGNRKMPGVLIHTQMVSQFLTAAIDDRPTFWFWPAWLETLWILTWEGLGVCIGMRLNHPAMLAVCTVVSLSALALISYQFFLHGGWIPIATPGLGLLLVSAAIVTYELQKARQQQSMVMRLLGQQTSPEIARALWQQRDSLLESGMIPGRTLTATVLFSDIHNFTTISEQTSTDLLMSWLNEYLQAMTREVTTHHGIVNKFIGDALMAVFGLPLSHYNTSEDARNAVSCALAMRDRLRELNDNWAKRGLPVIQIRIGIYTGSVMAGSLGGKERLEYGVIGDSVNIASRLESCEKDRQIDNCRILIARQTLIHVYGEFEVEFWGPLQLKGKQHSVEVYRVLGKLRK